MKKLYITSFLFLLFIYLLLAFGLPADPEVLKRYGLSSAGSRLATVSTITPLIIVYLSALYGFLRMDDYAVSVRATKEGPYFHKIARGLMVLAYSLPTSSILGSLVNYSRHRYPDLLPEFTIVRNYVTLALAFIAVLYIAQGALGLYGSLKVKKILPLHEYHLVGPIILAALFTWVVTRSIEFSGDRGYFLPGWLIVLTICIPYTIIWCIGFKAALQLYRYRQEIKGIVYQQALDYLSKGVGVIIASSIAIQLFTSMSGQLYRLNFAPFLLIVYCLIMLYAVGYGYVARGARKLKMIEEA